MNCYKDLLKKLKKEELIKVIEDYNLLAGIYGGLEIALNKKGKKDEYVKEIDDNKSNYIRYILMSLDVSDFQGLKILISKKWKNELLNEYRELVNYLGDKRILFLKNDIEITKDVENIIKYQITDKDVKRNGLKSNKIYDLVNGIIIAYGAIKVKDFEVIINNLPEKDSILSKINFYYKKDYVVKKREIVTKKLTNKDKIKSYIGSDKYKEFTIKEYINLGNNTYHHGIKAYKRFIKMLKNNYVFKKNDIEFVDNNIVIPYLYNSINEEKVATKNLEATIADLFEFKGDKLKQKMLKEIKMIREEFPLWEFRGFSKLEVNNEK